MSTNSYIASSANVENALFTLETFIENAKMEMYVTEGIAIAEGSINDLSAVHEAFKDKMKNAFQKLMDAIKKLWASFLEKVDAFVKSDNAYLKKYKDTIISKTLKEESYTMYPYWDGYSKMKSDKVPTFNFNALIGGSENKLESEERFLQENPFKKYSKNDKDFVEVAKTTFRGAEEPKAITSTKIPMSDMYEFCLNYNKEVDIIKKDMKQIDDAANHAVKLLNQVKTESVDELSGESIFYSFVQEGYITEAPTTPVKGSEDKDGDGEKDKKNSSVEGDNKKDKNKEDMNASPETKNKDIDSVKMYIRVCFRFLGAKLSIMEEMYKAYMFIIRDHVKSYIKGSENKNNSKDDKSEETKDDSKGTEGSDEKVEKPGLMTKIKNKVTGKNEAADAAFLESGELAEDDIDEDFIIDPDDDPDSTLNQLILEDE